MDTTMMLIGCLFWFFGVIGLVTCVRKVCEWHAGRGPGGPTSGYFPGSNVPA